MGRLRSLLTRPGVPSRDTEVDRELAFHLDALADEYRSHGMPPEAARRRARLEFGGREQVKQQVREVWISVALDRAIGNVRAAFRLLRHAPGFSCAVILTLALGIGANTAVFSAIDAILLRPLPFPDADRLMSIREYAGRDKQSWTLVAPARLEDWNASSKSFQALAGYYTQDESEISGRFPERLESAIVSPRFLTVLGIAPAAGRDFSPAEEHFGGPAVVLISDRLARSRFQSDAAAIGRQLHFGRSSLSVVGVLPGSFHFPDADVDLWIVNAPDAPYALDRASTWFQVVGRLRPGVAQAQGQVELNEIQQRLGERFPKTDRDLAIRIEPLKQVVVGEAGSSLWLLYGAVTLLLVIATINIAALLLARSADRQRELALRFALGATRRAIVAQLLSEVLVLSLLGSAGGLTIAYGGLALIRQVAATLPRAGEISLDDRLLLYTLGCAVAATLLCGLYPALHSTRRELVGGLALGGHQQVSSKGHAQWWLVGTQVALAVVLLVGAGLLVRSFAALGRVSPGFDPADVLVFQVSAGWGETTDMPRLTQRIERTLTALRAIPGVKAATTTANLPGVPGPRQTAFVLPGRARDDRQPLIATQRFVSAGYLATLRIPLLLGQDCGPSVITAGRLTGDVLVNRSFAERYLTGADVGGLIRAAGDAGSAPQARIRGVVADAREDGLNTAPTPTVYWCVSAPSPEPYFLLRTAGRPELRAESVRQALGRVEPSRSVFGISTLTQHLSENFSEDRLRTGLLTFFAATAVGLACVGLYGTLSYLARIRQREMGLRLAMGASRSHVAIQLLARGLRTVAFGCLAGAVLALFATRALRGMLFQVTVTDPVTYAGIVLLVVGVALVAAAGPAIRAARTDPAQALRTD